MSGKTGKCPVCGNQTPVPEDRDDFFCQYCGKSLHIKRAKPQTAAEQAVELRKFSITDPASGMPLAELILPGIFKVRGSILPNASCSEYPIKMTCAAFDPMGTAMTFFTGEGFTDSTKCPMLNGPFSQPVNRVNRIVYRRFMDGAAYADDYMSKVAADFRAQSLQYLEDRPLLIDGFDYQSALQRFQYCVERDMNRSGVSNPPPILGWYVKPVCRIYRFSIGGRVFQAAILLLLEAVKYQIPSTPMSVMPDLFYRKKSADPRNVSGHSGKERDDDFGVMPNNAVIGWRSDGVFMLRAVPEIFDAAFNVLFPQFCSGFRVSKQFLQQTEKMKDQINRDIAFETQANIRQQQAQFAAWQQANATRQAAFDSANQAWWARSNAAHAANRSAGMTAESSEDRMSRLRSEAIRGVNTYTREDGSETEVSVDYERAYTNAARDTLATNSSFEPGGNWTEMNRKK